MINSPEPMTADGSMGVVGLVSAGKCGDRLRDASTVGLTLSLERSLQFDHQ